MADAALSTLVELGQRKYLLDNRLGQGLTHDEGSTKEESKNVYWLYIMRRSWEEKWADDGSGSKQRLMMCV